MTSECVDTYADDNDPDKCLGQTLVLMVTLKLEPSYFLLSEACYSVPLEVVSGNQSPKTEYSLENLWSVRQLGSVGTEADSSTEG